ncbi:hypothetical protein [Burkholderia sp. 572]|uniref:hypothetical protein n=1 Tax=Burkholderia sp. 572 TaxID=3156414 RepID=UPI0033915425
MNTSNDLHRLVAAIRHDPTICPIDRELFRPLFAAFDGGNVFAVPEYVEKRVRHYAGRVSPQKQ